MKVVLFCGGLGTRLREHTETVPKPIVNIGDRPLLWHLMKYYAHFGHSEFVLCLGHMGHVIKDYFVNSSDGITNVSAVSEDEREIRVGHRDTDDWSITFADTGIDSNIGQRLLAVQPYVKDDPMFLANYSDGLSDLPLTRYLERFVASGKVAGFVSMKPYSSFHLVRFSEIGLVTDISAARHSDFWINGGFFAFRREIFDYLKQGEDLVEEPFQRLITESQLFTHPYDGFWACMDTYKDKKAFDRMNARDEMPWQVWR